MEWTRLSYHDDDDDDDAIDPAMLQASRPLSSSSRACVSRIDILARATIRRVAVWADDPSIRQHRHLFVDLTKPKPKPKSVLFCSVLGARTSKTVGPSLGCFDSFDSNARWTRARSCERTR